MPVDPDEKEDGTARQKPQAQYQDRVVESKLLKRDKKSITHEFYIMQKWTKLYGEKEKKIK